MDNPGGWLVVRVCPQNSRQDSCSNHSAPAQQSWDMEAFVVLSKFWFSLFAETNASAHHYSFETSGKSRIFTQLCTKPFFSWYVDRSFHKTDARNLRGNTLAYKPTNFFDFRKRRLLQRWPHWYIGLDAGNSRGLHIEIARCPQTTKWSKYFLPTHENRSNKMIHWKHVIKHSRILKSESLKYF